jgi:hypothetical protein
VTLLRALREAGIYSPAIGMTGRKEHIEHFTSAGAVGVLVLPFGVRALVEAVETALDGAE